MNISIAWTIDKLKITKQDVMKLRENFNLKEGTVLYICPVYLLANILLDNKPTQ